MTLDNMNHKEYLPFNKFMLRTPTFSYEALGEVLNEKDIFPLRERILTMNRL